MAKMKTKRKNTSDVIIGKSAKRKQPANPFEVHVNKQKFNVLGRKMKYDRGLPGVARAKSIKKRKETLLQEYKVKDKANKFLDRRIGEKNSAMTKEDKILARFTAERLRAHKRKAMFNLGEDEVLTHKGRSLAEIENFENPSSDEEDEHTKGKLDASFVEEAHFGGGLLKKADESKGRTTIIEQLIAESKKRKAEKQKAKEKTLEKTEQLDTEWRELMPVVAGSGGAGAPASEEIEKKDPYDLIMNQLKFEARGTPSDRLKSQTELAAAEATKLRELEEARLRRMRGEAVEVSEITEKKQHRSADDLDDGFDLQEDEDVQLLYDKEGNLISKFPDNEKDMSDEQAPSKIVEEEVNESEEESEEEEENENDDQNKNDEEKTNDESTDSEGEAVFDLSDMAIEENKEEDDEEEEDMENKGLDEEQTKENEVNKKAGKSGKDDYENKKTSNGVKEGDNINKKKVAFDPIVKTIEETIPKIKKTTEQLEKENEEKRKLTEQAKQELPFTFTIPELYDQLFELLEDKNIEQMSIIVERMIKCNHPSLNEKNKAELNKLFAFLLQFINDADHLDCWNILDHLSPFLFELTQFSPANAAYCLSEVIVEKHNEYLQKKHRYPTFETLAFLKLIPLLFPTSDKRHPITTPAFAFITEMLHQCQVTTRRAVASGLFLVTLISQYVTLSKRILPEAINFLCGIVHLATPISSKGLIVPPFQKDHKFLFLHKPFLDLDVENIRMQSSDLAPKSVKIDDKFRVRSIYTALGLLGVFIELWKDITGSWLLLSPIMDHITSLEVTKYPIIIGQMIEKLKKTLDEIKSKGFEPIIKQQKKPKALRLYDPNIQPVYDNRKRKHDDKSDRKKILTKYKQEMKGALREIRKDRSFLANVKFKEIAKSDAERVKKVKQIYSWGSQQQGELNKLARRKKRKK